MRGSRQGESLGALACYLCLTNWGKAMSDEPRLRAKTACDCCFEVTAVCAKTLLCAVCVRHAAASFAIEVRRAELKKAREELGKPPKGTA